MCQNGDEKPMIKYTLSSRFIIVSMFFLASCIYFTIGSLTFNF